METIEQYQNALEIEAAKCQSGLEMIQELIRSNLHLRAAVRLAETQIKNLTANIEKLAKEKNELQNRQNTEYAGIIAEPTIVQDMLNDTGLNV